YRAAGQPSEAARQYELVGAMQRLFAANGVDLDLEIALFNLDHDRDLASSLAQVRSQVARRPSIKADDALAWGLYKNGDCQEAQQAMTRALRLGTQDALMFFHAGLISECVGQRAEARGYLERATALNPRFSLLYADRARETLARLAAGPTTAASAAGGAL